MTRVRPKAPASPATTPITASVIPCLTTSREHIDSLRAERHADADFLGALRDRVSHHAVNADGGEEQAPRMAKTAKSCIETRRVPNEFVTTSSIVRTL